MGNNDDAHDPSACLREAEAASLRRRQVGVRRRHLPKLRLGRKALCIYSAPLITWPSGSKVLPFHRCSAICVSIERLSGLVS